MSLPVSVTVHVTMPVDAGAVYVNVCGVVTPGAKSNVLGPGGWRTDVTLPGAAALGEHAMFMLRPDRLGATDGATEMAGVTWPTITRDGTLLNKKWQGSVITMDDGGGAL